MLSAAPKGAAGSVKREDAVDFDIREQRTEPPENEPERQAYFLARARENRRRTEEKIGRPLTYCLCTFGCQMNARDSEKLSGILSAAGYRPTDREDADVVLYNTCTVRENANNRLYGHLGCQAASKRQNPHRIIALCGCMMQEKGVREKIRERYPFVDLIFGTFNLYKFAELLAEAQESDGMVTDIRDEAGPIVENLPNRRKYDFKTGVNIMYGCDNFCSYCIVPYVRGRERSRKPEEILDEIRSFVSDGVKEVMLLGQNVNSYGKNLAEPVSFAKLLSLVTEIPGVERIRFMTSHPKDLSEELIETMASSEKICPHIHLPLQSGSSRLLQVMNRHYTKEEYLALTERIRDAVPEIAITTDLIVGFPGETEEDFLETLDVVRRVRFDNAFTFLYSKRTGTPAAEMENQIPHDVAQQRFDRLLREVQEIAGEQAARLTGSVRDVLVETGNRRDPNYVTGRLGNNSVVHFPGDESLIGQIVPVRLVECKGFYYLGVVVS